jgi:hypothetical protein
MMAKLSFDLIGHIENCHTNIKKSERSIVIFSIWKLMTHIFYYYQLTAFNTGFFI